MKCSDVITILEQLAPESIACSWDNTGLLLGSREKEVRRIAVTLDVTDAVVEEALAWKADLIVSHHPLIFVPMKKITTDGMNGRRIWKLAGADIACYAMHTSFDSAPKGMAWLAASRLGLEEMEVLDDKMNDTDAEGVIREVGIGMVGNLPKPVPCSVFIRQVKEVFSIPAVSVYTASPEAMIQRVALCPGSGKDYIASAIKSGAQVYLTGDVGHHNGLDAREMGLTVIDASHYHMEKIFVPYVREYLQSNLEGAAKVREILDLCPFEVW